MAFDINEAAAILERTPGELRALLGGLRDLAALRLTQACRVMAGRYREDVGPWREYLPITAPRR